MLFFCIIYNQINLNKCKISIGKLKQFNIFKILNKAFCNFQRKHRDLYILHSENKEIQPTLTHTATRLPAVNTLQKLYAFVQPVPACTVLVSLLELARKKNKKQEAMWRHEIEGCFTMTCLESVGVPTGLDF